MTIVEAASIEDVESARSLFKEYAAWLDVDLCFQNFDQELANLPADYAPPGGCLLLGFDDGQLAGCVALRKSDREGLCEMKRLFLRAAFSGKGSGRQLAEAVIQKARNLGYKRMCLDTMPGRMERAASLYRALGFKEIEPYYNSPIPDTKFMELVL